MLQYQVLETAACSLRNMPLSKIIRGSEPTSRLTCESGHELNFLGTCVFFFVDHKRSEAVDTVESVQMAGGGG